MSSLQPYYIQYGREIMLPKSVIDKQREYQRNPEAYWEKIEKEKQAKIAAKNAQPKQNALNYAQRPLLVAATACTALNFIPPLRLGASIALRSIALISSSLTAGSRWSEESFLGKLSKIGKVAGVAIGLVALTLAMPALMAASLGVDMGVQLFEAGRAIKDGKAGQAFLHLGIAIVDALALAGIVAGSWKLMVAATSINITMMAGAASICFYNGFDRLFNDQENIAGAFIDAMCYVTLMSLGISSAVKQISPETFTEQKYHFQGKNETDKTMYFYDAKDRVIFVAKPGETYDFKCDPQDILIPFKGRYVEVFLTSGEKMKLTPTETNVVYDTTFREPMAASEFPKLALGGPSYNIPVKESIDC